MQFKTKVGLVDIPNDEVMAASRDISGSERSPSEIAAPSGSFGVGRGSLQVSRAGVLALIEEWEGMALAYRSQKGKPHHWQKASLLEVCSEGLRRVAGLTELRQPEEA